MNVTVSNSAVEADRVQHRARVRAAAVALLDTQANGRALHIPSDRILRRAERRRIHAPAPRAPARERTGEWRRGGAVAALVAQFAALAALLFLPVFQVRDVVITGSHLLTRAAILDAASVRTESIVTVDGSAIRRRLAAVPWIRSAVVTTAFPGTVHIAIVEWSPVLRMHRDGQDTLVADSGATIDAGAGEPGVVARIPVLVDERPGGNPPAPPPSLIQTLDATSTTFPSIFGCSVVAYEWRADGVFVIWTSTGWSAVLGHITAQSQIDAIGGQLSALAALSTTLDFKAPHFGYVDLENVDAPAVGGNPGLPAPIRAALTVGKAATPSQVSTAPGARRPPEPSPAAPGSAPTPTPYVVYIAPPSH